MKNSLIMYASIKPITWFMLCFTILVWLAVICMIPYSSDQCIIIESKEFTCRRINDGDGSSWVDCISNVIVLSRNIKYNFTVGCHAIWCSPCLDDFKKGTIQTCCHTIMGMSLNPIENLLRMIAGAVILTCATSFTTW
jgi:hypothetical protein